VLIRRVIIFFLPIFFFTCEIKDHEKIVILANYQLKNGAILNLQEKTGGYLGATTPNVTWINKTEKNGQELQVGKIKQLLDMGEISFEPVNDSLIKLLYVDSIWHHTSIYIINVNQRIYPNDGSAYLEAK
jgi:hypothetical protein